jgi:uncharacterized protein YutE (UPF0331/DUF86 family)
MTNLSIIENKISQVKKYLKILERYKKYSVAEIKNDVDVRGMVERYAFLAVQATIDLAETAVAYKHSRKPTTMTETFYILDEEGIIDKKLSEKMVNMVGFRNIITHNYEEVNYDIVYDVVHKGVLDIKKFLTVIRKKL